MSESNPNLPAAFRRVSQRPFLAAALAGLLLFLSFPPVGWWFTGWIAVVPYLFLIAIPEFDTRRPWLQIWLAGCLFWAAETYYVVIPHPALWIGWILLFTYLSVYPLLFVWISRKCVHGHRLPLWLAAPIVFTALEWVRAHALSGFGFGMLSNSQYQVPWALQVCDLAGGYGLTFLMVGFAVGLFQFLVTRHWRGLTWCLLILAGTAGYGYWKLSSTANAPGMPLNAVVVQGNIDTRFPETEQELAAYREQLFNEYMLLQTSWQREHPGPIPQLIVWPEGKYPVPHVLSGTSREHQAIREDFLLFHKMLFRQSSPHPSTEPATGPWMIVGASTLDPQQRAHYNSALLLGTQGQVLAAYHKMHLVPFGEFIPFGDWVPWLAKLTPIGSGLQPGARPVGFEMGSLMAAPSVCFESAVTHRIRESVAYLRSLGKEPDLLVNITDDGWFYGHPALDHHLACNVMRAVENRKPMIVAANTGLSAFIQSSGQILAQGPRRQAEVMQQEFELKPGRSLYTVVGDWPAAALTILTVLAILRRPGQRIRKPQVPE